MLCVTRSVRLIDAHFRKPGGRRPKQRGTEIRKADGLPTDAVIKKVTSLFIVRSAWKHNSSAKTVCLSVKTGRFSAALLALSGSYAGPAPRVPRASILLRLVRSRSIGCPDSATSHNHAATEGTIIMVSETRGRGRYFASECVNTGRDPILRKQMFVIGNIRFCVGDL